LKLIKGHQRLKDKLKGFDPEEDPQDVYNKELGYAGHYNLNNKYLKRPENLIEKDTYLARFQDKDIDLGPIFAEGNTHYRQKFQPNISEFYHLAEHQSSEDIFWRSQESLYSGGPQIHSAYKNPSSDATNYLKKFNKKPADYFELIKFNNYKVFGLQRDHLTEKDVYRVLKDDIINLRQKEDYGQYTEFAKGRQQETIQDQIDHTVKVGFGRLGKAGHEFNKKAKAKSILKKGFKDRGIEIFEGPKKEVIFHEVAHKEELFSNQGGSNKTSLVRLEKPDEVQDRDSDLLRCPEGCGRKFGQEQFDKHVRICKRTFQKKRERFDIKKKREITKGDSQFKNKKKG
jgi:hypothetical protein